MVAIERVERRLEVLNALTNTGKKKKLTAAKQREVRDLGAELAYHQHLLEQARATIAEAENRNRALQEDRAVAEEQLQSAVVAANATNINNIIFFTAFECNGKKILSSRCLDAFSKTLLYYLISPFFFSLKMLISFQYIN